MGSLLRTLWQDDRAAIISVEWILIVAILLFGLIPGFIALRNTLDASMGTIGNILMTLVPSFNFSGFGLGTSGNPNLIAGAGGRGFTPTGTVVLTSSQLAPEILTGQQVNPAP